MNRKPWIRAGLTIFVASSVMLMSTGAASAAPVSDELTVSPTTDTSRILSDIADLTGKAATVVTGLVPDAAVSVEGYVVTEDSIATLPSETDESLSLMSSGNGDEISLSLPDADLTSSDGAVSAFEGPVGDSFITQVTAEGTVQVVNIATAPRDTHSFDIATSIPEGSHWELAASGSLTLLDTLGNTLAATDTPWAIDADGKYLPTSFTLSGDTITQTVDTANAAFPVVSDPSLWWVIGTSALCAAEIASLAVGAAKVVAAFAKADKIVKASKAVVKSYKALGGTMKSVVDLVKKYAKNKASLTKAQINALGDFINKVGTSVFNILGLGSCYALATTH